MDRIEESLALNVWGVELNDNFISYTEITTKKQEHGYLSIQIVKLVGTKVIILGLKNC